jgi:Tfp pilus assembly protein PilX
VTNRRVDADVSDHRDTGAVLVLALVFLVVVSLIGGTLVAWVGNDLRNTTHLKGDRTFQYAASGVTEIEIQGVRYIYTANVAWSNCTPGGGASFTLDSQALEVFCNTALAPTSAATRVVTLDTCPSSESQSTCTANPYLQAIVTFNDYSNANSYHCTSATDEATCGTGMSISSWIIQ